MSLSFLVLQTCQFPEHKSKEVFKHYLNAEFLSRCSDTLQNQIAKTSNWCLALQIINLINQNLGDTGEIFGKLGCFPEVSWKMHALPLCQLGISFCTSSFLLLISFVHRCVVSGFFFYYYFSLTHNEVHFARLKGWRHFCPKDKQYCSPSGDLSHTWLPQQSSSPSSPAWLRHNVHTWHHQVTHIKWS